MKRIEEQYLLPDRLRQYPIFEQLEHSELLEMGSGLQEHRYAAGETILRQGQVSSRFHIVVSGSLDVRVGKEVSVSVAKLGRGHFFGEMSCLTGVPVSATVQAETPVHTVSLERSGLFRLMDMSRSFRRHMLESMVQRIADSNRLVLDEHTRSYVVTQQLERERERQLGQFVGSSKFMHELRARLDAAAANDDTLWIVGEEGVGKFHAACEIHKRSPRGRSPMLTMDGAAFHLDEWRMKALAAKDGTIIIRNGERLPSELLSKISDTSGSARLIMTARQLPQGAKAPVLELVPLRDRKEDIPELVREFLAREGVVDAGEAISPDAMRMLGSYPYLHGNIEELGKTVGRALALSEGRTITSKHIRFGRPRQSGDRPKIGLALGSGSVRGAAHVGVIKALEEANIPIDYIAGTSVGAFIGALYAGGQPVEAFERVLPNVRWRQLVSPVLPPKAFADNHPMVRFVEKYIGPVDFDQLSIPFAAVASDAVTGEAYILNKGRVSRAICASTAIPGVMKPVSYDGRLLIDGGVVHPVPAALARSMGADIVIAVDVGIPPFMRRRPANFVASILNTIDIMSEKIVQEEVQLADVVLKPQLEMTQMTFKASSLYIAKGVETARQAMDMIEARIRSF